MLDLETRAVLSVDPLLALYYLCSVLDLETRAVLSVDALLALYYLCSVLDLETRAVLSVDPNSVTTDIYLEKMPKKADRQRAIDRRKEDSGIVTINIEVKIGFLHSTNSFFNGCFIGKMFKC